MYKFKNEQLSLTDFGAAVGLKLNPDNRWIKKARSFVHKTVKKQLGYLSRDISHIDSMLTDGKTLGDKQSNRLDTIWRNGTKNARGIPKPHTCR